MRRRGFTLIELTVVMAIIALLLTMAVGAHYSWKRYSALDAAETQVVAMLAKAREVAISSGRSTIFVYGNYTFTYGDDVLQNTLLMHSSDRTTNAPAGWCCILSMSNAVDFASTFEEFERADDKTEYPLVGPVLKFERPVLWGLVEDAHNGMGPDYEGSRYNFFLPDGSLAEPVYSPQGCTTSVLYGAQWSEYPANRRVIEILPRSGAARALTREERERIW